MDIGSLVRMTLAASAVALALLVGTQATAAGSQSTTASGTPAASGGSSTTKPAAKKHHKHHASSHGSHAQQRSMGAASPMNTGQMGYQAALRQCVEGPAARRDGCLDDAIARYGRT